MSQGQGGGRLKLPSHLRPVSDTRLAETVAETAPKEAPQKPSAVSDDEQLSEMWDQLVPTLDAAGLLSPADAYAIEMLLRHVLVARQAAGEIGESVVVNDHHIAGGKKKHPAEAVFRSESEMFLRYAQQLGMTFVARARTPSVKASDDGGEANPFAAKTLG